jgi:diguanylate cyclase (GGDEF)-like protein
MSRPSSESVDRALLSWWTTTLAPVAFLLVILFAGLLAAAALAYPVDVHIAIPGLPVEIGVALGVVYWTILVFAGNNASTMTRTGGHVSLSALPLVAAATLGGPIAAALVALVGTLDRRELKHLYAAPFVWNRMGVALPILAATFALEPLRRSTLASRDTLVASLLVSVAIGLLHLAANVWLALWGNARLHARRVPSLIAANSRGVLTLVSLTPVSWLLSQAYLQVAWWSVVVVGGVVVSWMFAVKQDETDRRLREDALTGIQNHLGIRRHLEKALHRRGTQRIAVFFLDLDRFKPVNDQLGHDVGDKLLVEVARRLASFVRPGDAVGRLGGDEFCIVATGIAGSETAASIAERLKQAVAEPWYHDDQEILVTASVGYALSPVSRQGNAEHMLRAADQGMYRDKGCSRPTSASDGEAGASKRPKVQ